MKVAFFAGEKSKLIERDTVPRGEVIERLPLPGEGLKGGAAMFFPFPFGKFFGVGGLFSKSPQAASSRGRGAFSLKMLPGVTYGEPLTSDFAETKNKGRSRYVLPFFLWEVFWGLGGLFSKSPPKRVPASPRPRASSRPYFTLRRCQMRSAYSSMLRSAAKWPAAAILRRDMRFHFSLSW